MAENFISRPQSKFLKIKCTACGNEQTMFDHAKTVIECHVCGEVLANPAGGKAKLTPKAELIEVLES